MQNVGLPLDRLKAPSDVSWNWAEVGDNNEPPSSVQ